jgi:beta-glucanase (GH16 family)
LSDHTTKSAISIRRFEVRAKIPVASGAWSAIWLLGNKWEWPQNGEIDMMEYYIKDGKP